MMKDAIENFFSQFEYKPEMKNSDKRGSFKKFVVVGMGGSNLATGILKAVDPMMDIIEHRDYGLPNIPENELKSRLIILSSFSGNTEEVIDAFFTAKEKGLSTAIVCAGGKLKELAGEYFIPYVEMPNTGIEPRSALGFSFRALAKMMGREDLIKNSDSLIYLKANDFNEEAKKLAEFLKGYAPVFCASYRNEIVARIAKIVCNETSKVPSFYNMFPELNHNEMTSYDVRPGTKDLSKNFRFIFFRDYEDAPKNLRRMEITKKLYEDRGFSVGAVDMVGKNPMEKIFSALVASEWTAHYLATAYGVEEEVPMVEEFKALIR